MRLLVLAAGVAIVLVVLWDGFEAIVLPRRVARRLRLVVGVARVTWGSWAAIARRLPPGIRRETYLSYFGPLLLILLLVTWAAGLVFGFALIHWGLGSALEDPAGPASLLTDLYLSGTTFFTLGLGDVAPRTWAARFVTVIESGVGFGFLALVVGYLPVFYNTFAARETHISMLDEWAGSPPTAAALLGRLGRDGSLSSLEEFLHEWEHWCAELLESHLSYPVLGYFRSQHGNQSWLAGLTTVLDVCALTLAAVEEAPRRAAWLTFAMARHTAVDLCQVFAVSPLPPPTDRLPGDDRARLWAVLSEAGLSLRTGEEAAPRLTELRRMYEPYAAALSRRLLMSLPAWLPAADARDNWQRSPWR
jgi:hypothetical protein